MFYFVGLFVSSYLLLLRVVRQVVFMFHHVDRLCFRCRFILLRDRIDERRSVSQTGALSPPAFVGRGSSVDRSAALRRLAEAAFTAASEPRVVPQPSTTSSSSRATPDVGSSSHQPPISDMVGQMSALLSPFGFIVVPDPAHQPPPTSVVSSVTDRLPNGSPIQEWHLIRCASHHCSIVE